MSRHLKALFYRLKSLCCRIVGHDWRENVLWVAGQRCSSVQCERCMACPYA